jgi:hypothetical protein
MKAEDIEKLETPIVIELKYPIKRGEKEGPLEKVVFERHAIADDFKGLSARLTIEEQIILAARLSEIPRPILGRMKAPDMFRMLEELTGFLQPGQTDGKTPSEA